ncbi:hypothetical protein CYY_001450 [Polysphondylium violaceum]|uniref:Cytochrome P450 family protein n=1 Tax=Polysphondylium violaceum TaxID=133409 RepID=A0A8J4Q9D7_9MYCE|nr:hypothetical protein CYY_001450 [Polysphondylium violaceum]
MYFFWALLYSFFAYLVFKYIQKFKNYGPNALKGPFPLPLVGNLHQIGSTPHKSLTKLHDTYGPIYRVWMGDRYSVIVNDIQLMREMIVTNNDTFLNRPKSPSLKYYSGNYISDVSSSSDEVWKRHRDIAAAALTKTKMKHIYTLLDQQVDDLLTSMSIVEKSGQAFEPRRYSQRFTMNTMLKYIFNKHISYDEDVNSGLMKEIIEPSDAIFQELGTGALGDFIDIFKPFTAMYLNLFDKNAPALINFAIREYKEHLETYTEEHKATPRDFMDVLITEFSDDPDKVDKIAYMSIDVLLAATDTTATSIEWAFLYLANYPEMQEKAAQELVSVAGKDRNLSLADRQSTPFTNALIKEIARHKVIGPFGLIRHCSADIEIGGHFIPKDSQVLFNYMSIGANPKYWENPSEFNPSRFLGPNPQDFPMFSLGPRSCVGKSLALDELFLGIGNVIKKFKVSSTDGKPISDADIFGLTIRPTKFYVTLKERN